MTASILMITLEALRDATIPQMDTTIVRPMVTADDATSWDPWETNALHVDLIYISSVRTL